MTDSVRFVRRNRVDEGRALAIAAVAGVIGVLAGAEPTGSTAVDIVLVFLCVAAGTWASASAAWWASAAAAGIAASIALDPIVAGAGAIGFVGGLVIGLRRQDQSEIRAIVGGIALNVLLRSELDGFLGLSALIGVSVGLALVVLGLLRRPRRVRRIGWIALGSIGGFLLLSLLGLAAAGNAARPDVSAGADAARSGIDLLSDGDYEAAAAQLEQASLNFDSADNRLGGPLALPARLIPGVAQNVRAGTDLSKAASSALGDAARALRQVDPAALTVAGGKIDVEAVRAVAGPLATVRSVLDQLRASISDVRSPWLVGRLDEELDELNADLDEQEPRLDNAIEAVRLAPQMLGGDGLRRYLILFTTPAEARGLGGFVGNYAEMTIDDGQITVSDFARRSDLQQFVTENGVRCDGCPQEFLDRYGTFGFVAGPDGTPNFRAWLNITMPAHFPYVAEVASILYPQSGGRFVDGVIVMDPYVVQELMKYTGPIEVPEFGVTVQPSEAAQFILEDQYVLASDDADPGTIDNTERVDALDTLGQGVIARLLSGSLPEPPELAGDLAPLVAERRLLLWTDDSEEQDFLDRIGLLGSLPALDPTEGGFSVSVTNAGGSKIDVFLERDVTVDVVRPDDGPPSLKAIVEFTNTAPSSGLPEYVIGNILDLPTGTSRLYVTFYGPPGLENVLLDGEPIDVSSGTEAGWFAYSTFVNLAPGQTRSYELSFDLNIAASLSSEAPTATGVGDGEPEPTVFVQPLAERP